MQKICLFFAFVASILSLTQAQMTITLSRAASCSASSFKLGDMCQFTMTIALPPKNSTTLYVEVFTSDLNATYAQLCRPWVSIDPLGFPGLATPEIQMVGDFTTKSQFDRAILDFGTVTNANQVNASIITIDFNVVMLSNSLPANTQIWVTGGAEYFSGTEVWVGQVALNYTTSADPSTGTTPAGSITPMNANVEITKSGSFEYSLNANTLRSYSLVASATSSSTAVAVCSIHVKSASWCYHCLNSVKTYFTSSGDATKVTLDLGNVINSGINSGTTANNTVTFLVTYRVLDSATASATANIVFALNITNLYGSFSSSQTATHVVTATTAVSSDGIAPIPTITASLSKTSIRIYESFYLRIRVSIPSTFDNSLKLDVVGNSTDGTPLMKLCYIDVSYTGENVPCSNCMNMDTQYSYSPLTNPIAYDRITWNTKSIKNRQLRTTTENKTVNDIVFDVYGQLIDNNVSMSSNLSVLACVTYGNQSLWISESFFTISSLSANYSTSNDTSPTFNIDYADAIGSAPADMYQTRMVYFDIFTKPGAIYQPLNVEVVMPETVTSNNIPAATVCKVRVLSVGKYASCVQPGVINNEPTGYITYLSRMIRWKNDKAIISLGSVCNIGTTQTNDADGQIRLILYIQLEDEPTAVTDNYIGVGVQYTATQLFVGQITLSKTASNLYSFASKSPYYYFDTTATNTSVVGGSYAVANLVLKVPPNTRARYSFDTSIQSSLTAGSASVCSIRYSKQGNNVPCTSLLSNNFNYNTATATYYKTSGFTYAGVLCSINDQSINVNSVDSWDEDSVNIEILTKTSMDASGTYTLRFLVLDSTNNASFVPKTFTWTVTPNGGSGDTYTTTSSNISFTSVDLNTNTSASSTTFYKGQTSILRYTFLLNEPKSFDLKLSLNSTLAVDDIDIQRFFISSIGDNLPCTTSKLQPATFLYGSKYPYQADLLVGPVCYFPIDSKNVSASMITVEAHVRIPPTSAFTGAVTFRMGAWLNNQFNGLVSASIDGTVADPSASTVSLAVKNITMYTTATTSNLTIHENVTFTTYLYIPAFTSARVKYRFLAVDNTTSSQFGHIWFSNITHVGRNVDGFAKDFFTYNLLKGNLSNTQAPSYYVDAVEYDLGIVTNTQYGVKMDNYDPYFDDLIIFTVSMMVTDNAALEHLATMTAQTIVSFGSGDVPTKTWGNRFTVFRSGLEKADLSLVAVMQNPAATYTTNTLINVNFVLQHLQTTTAEAHNLTVRFFIPRYVSVQNSSVSLSAKLTSPTYSADMLSYKVNSLYFGEVLSGSFSLLVDSSNMYKDYIQQFGTAPTKVDIPFVAEYQKIFRATPAPGDTPGAVLGSSFGSLYYNPQSVTVVFPNVTTLKSQIQACQLTASVNNALAKGVFTTGWKTDYKANDWFDANSNYLTIAFGNLTSISRIVMRQFLATPATTPFSKFRISYSNDNVSFAFSPEDSYPILTIPNAYSYVIPNGPIECRFLRIHITAVETPANMASKQTGFFIDEIWGRTVLQDRTVSSVCPTGQVTNAEHYVSRSVLYLPNNLSVYVCDEVPDRSQGLCYSSTDANPTKWKLLPPTVSVVVFWVYDNDLLKGYLYGVGMDKRTYVRSDDSGLTWKSISLNEFNTVLANAQSNTQKFLLKYYTQLPTTTLTSFSSTPWSAGPTTVNFNSANVLDWFN